MELYASGFNAHHQLQHRNESSEDLNSFTLVEKVTDYHRASPIKIWAALWSATVLELDGVLLHWGQSGEWDDTSHLTIAAGNDVSSENVRQFFGDASGVLGALRNDGDCFVFSGSEGEHKVNRNLSLHTRKIRGERVDYHHVAIAENDELCICTRSRKSREIVLHVFASAQAFFLRKEEIEPIASHALPCELISLHASATSFTALLADHKRVWTFGSALHSSMLARTPTPSAPPGAPSDVTFLGGIPIRKVATCGWLCAALSEDHDLYVWGGRAGGKDRVSALPDQGDEVKLVDVNGGVDIVDFAVGMGHILVLTAEGEVWGCGDNEHGQLGLIGGQKEFVEDWVKLNGELEGIGKVVSIGAGGWGSWIILDSRKRANNQVSRVRRDEVMKD